MASDASFATIAELAPAIQSGALRSVDLTERLLDRIGRLNGALHAIVGLTRERALAEAATADAMIGTGDYLGPLHGIPYLAKDLFDVAGEVTTAGSRAMSNAPAAERDSAVVARLRRAGAVIMGRTNMTEFAYSGIGINPHFGTPRNPWDRATGRIPGGSSSGAAISVTDGMAAAGLGTDTAGSVRIPAAFCGLAGFKPTVGRVPTDGVFPLSTTLDMSGRQPCATASSVMYFSILPILTAPLTS